jgi:hypothetical protein
LGFLTCSVSLWRHQMETGHPSRRLGIAVVLNLAALRRLGRISDSPQPIGGGAVI